MLVVLTDVSTPLAVATLDHDSEDDYRTKGVETSVNTTNTNSPSQNPEWIRTGRG